MTSSNEEVRANALYSVRLMDSEKALNSFGKAFGSEQSENVLKRAVKSFRHLKPSDSFLKVVSNSVLAHEDNPRLLKSILKNSYLNVRENEFSKDTYIKMIEETSHSSKKEST